MIYPEVIDAMVKAGASAQVIAAAKQVDASRPESRGPRKWFACEESAMLVAQGSMPAEHWPVYTAIYFRVFEVDGPITDDASVLARRAGLTARRIEKALRWLLDHDIIESLPDGRIDVPATREILADRRRRCEGTSAVAKAAAKKRWQKDQRKQRNDDAHDTESFSLRSKDSIQASAPPQPLADEAVAVPISDQDLEGALEKWNGHADYWNGDDPYDDHPGGMIELPQPLRGKEAADVRRSLAYLMTQPDCDDCADPAEALDLVLDKIEKSFWIRSRRAKKKLEFGQALSPPILGRLLRDAFEHNLDAEPQERSREGSFLPTPASGGFLQIRGTA